MARTLTDSRLKLLLALATLVLLVCAGTDAWHFHAVRLIYGCNLIASLGILIYWMRKRMRRTEFFRDRLETWMNAYAWITALTSALGFMTYEPWVRAVAVLLFSILTLGVILFLILMYTFKMKRLW